jgi:hypothetical protein
MIDAAQHAPHAWQLCILTAMEPGRRPEANRRPFGLLYATTFL